MNLTKHIKERYVERIIGITAKNKVKQYIVENESKIESDITKMFENSEFLWKGQIGDNITRNFYIRDNIVLIADTGNTALITLFKIDFGFPTETNRTVIKDLKNEIVKLVEKYELESTKENEVIDKMETEIEQNKSEIELLQKKIELLKEKNSLLGSEIKVKRTGSNLIQEEIKNYASKLINSIEYRQDIKVN